jgi:hypothetical protein
VVPPQVIKSTTQNIGMKDRKWDHQTMRHFAGSMEQWPMTTAGMKSARTVQLATTKPGPAKKPSAAAAVTPPSVWLKANKMSPRMFPAQAKSRVEQHPGRDLGRVVAKQLGSAEAMSAYGDKLLLAAQRA